MRKGKMKKLSSSRRMKIKKLKTSLVLAIILFTSVSMIGFVNHKPTQTTIDISIKIIFPLNQTYDVENIILNVSTDFLASEIFRSIDGSSNYTECMNCTGFTRYNLVFSEGGHTINVYARDFENRVVQANVAFTVQTK